MAVAGEGDLVAKLTRDSKVVTRVTRVLGEKVRQDKGGGLNWRHVQLLYFFSLLSFGELKKHSIVVQNAHVQFQFSTS